MMKLKKLITLLTTTILTSTFFTGCSNNNSGINGTINVYNCADYIDESLISKFEDETGIKVIYDKYDTNEIMYQKIQTSPVYLIDEIKDNMIAGEKALATVYSGDASYSISGNPNLKYAIPQEGSNRWVDSMTIPKGAPNKAGAEAFINFLCDPENAKINVEYIEYSTPNYGAYELLDDDVKNNPVAYPPEYVLDKCSIFTDLDKKSLKLYEEAFMDVLTH